MFNHDHATIRMTARILVLALLLPSSPLFAAPPVVVAPGSGNTAAQTSANGVTVVNINTANGAGLSHNKFTDYNVPTNGVVLNNGDYSQMSRQSQLAGQVAANMNLTTPARVILNEVVSTNRSVMQGYTEVLGSRADVVVANPNGITCAGCGFINTDRVSLITGTPNLAGDGSIRDFNVSRGDILINGAGLDGSAQQYLDLVSRSVRVDGQINAPSIRVVVGNNVWNYGSALVTGATTAEGAAPGFAFDSTLLGGMYANRIKLIATEAGVGVRMQGEAAASGDDFSINAAGKIDIRSKVFAQRDLTLSTTVGGVDAITLSDANLSARRNLELTATSGGATLTGGVLVAGNNLTATLGSLTDTASATAMTDNNKRYAGGTVTLATSGTANLDGVTYGSGGSFSGNFDRLALGAGRVTLYSGDALLLRAANGDLALADSVVRSVGDLTLTSDNGSISTSAGAGQGVQSTSGNLALTAANGLSNGGTISADAGNVTVRVDGAVNNSGTLNAGGALDLANKTGGTLASLGNTGKLRGGSMNVAAASMAVTGGGVVETTGNLNLNLGSLVVGGVGDTTSRIVAATSGAGTATIAVASAFTNYGAVHSGQHLTFTAPSITNTATGGISALDTLTVRATSGDLLNQGALYAGQHLVASANGTLTNDGTLSGAMGTIDSGGDMNLSSSLFVNNSEIRSAGDLTITAATFRNEVKGGDTRVWVYGTQDETYTGGTGWYYCGVDQCLKNYFRTEWTDYQRYAGGKPLYSPQIVAGSANVLKVQGFSTGSNLGGKISAGTVTFSGNTGATFVNDALSALNKDYYYTFERYWEDWLVGDSGIDGDIRNQSATVTTTSTLYTVGASIRANTLNMGGFALVNNGSPYTASPTVRSASGAGFAGLAISLPTNPNGYFVVSKNPNSRYLVETNPLYTSKNAIGSDYLTRLLGVDPDTLMKRLGDAGYETYLVRQQLIAQTGSNLLKGYGDEAALMRGLMDQGASQSKSLGLKLGEGLSRSQQAALKEDMVWLVETNVGGQKVLTPVVYLAASTRAAVETGGAVIAADKANLNLASLSNTGGTIAGSTALNVTTQGDIKNTSGTIKGSDVTLTSTQGSILNRTLVETSGDDSERKTTIGKQAGIVSTGTLTLDASKDITSLGGKIASGGDAKLVAGGNVTLDTVENKSASTTHSGRTDTTTRTTEQVRSELSSAGNLTIQSRNDITVAGSTINVQGNAALDAGGDLNIVARDNTKQVVSKSENEGFGVGGGLWGKEKTTTDTFQSRSVGSAINVGGDANLSAGKTATIQGSAVNSGGSTNIAAQDVQVLAARDIDRTTTTKETQTILSISAGENPKTDSLAKSGVVGDGQVKASAKASATNDAGGLDFSKNTKTETTDTSTRAVVSTLSAGKNLTITSRKDTTLEGTRIDAKGDVNLSGQNVNVLAAQDTHTTTSKTTTTKVGLYASTTNAADAKAGAGAGATAVAGSANANAGSTAVANAGSSTSIDVMRKKTTETETVDITNKGSNIAAGGNLHINTAKTLTVQGSDLSGEQSVDIKAKDMAFVAAQDTHSSTTKTSSTSAGLYIDGNASANAAATSSANAGLGANAGAKAEAGAKAVASIGVQGKNTTTSDSEGSSTARVSTITSGSGSITRKASNSITDVGTSIDAAGDFSQSAKTITSKAAENTTYSTSSSTTNTAKIGVYAKAEAGATADAGASAGMGLDGKPKAEAGANAEVTAKVGAGIKASYTRDASESSASSSDAVVSTIKSGGKVSSISSDKTSLEGTKISGSKGVEIDAGSLDFAAAKNTTSSSSSVGNINASASVGVSRGTGKGVDIDVAGGTSKTDKSASSSTAVAGAIESGGNIVVKTKGDTRFEGTNLDAKGDTTVAAGGNLTFDAARDTTSSNKTAYDASASLSTSKSSGGAGKSSVDASVSGGFSKSTAETSTATAGSINSGGKVNLSAGKSASFEGTNIAAGGDATISAKDGVTMSAARSTSSSESYGVRAGVDVGSGKESNATESSKSKSVGATVEGNYSRAKSSTAEAGSVQAGGNLKIVSGKDVTLEGTNLAANGKASVVAGGSVNFKAAESTSESVGFSASLSGKSEKTDKTPTPAAKKTAPTPAADPAKAKNPGTGGTQGSDGSKQSNEDLSKWQKNQSAVNQELKDKQNAAAAKPAAGSTVPAPDAGAAGKKTPPPVPTAPKPERKDSGSSGVPAASGSDVAGKKTPPPVPTAPKPERKDAGGSAPAATANDASGKTAAPASAATSSASDAGAAGKKTPPPVPTAPKPEHKNVATGTPPVAAPAAEESGPTTEKATSVAAGAQFQMKNKTTQTAGSISAGAGGVEIVAKGGDVNLVGTNINTEGDANISAKRDVNISATKNTDSSFGVSAAVSADKKSETPTVGSKTPPAAAGAGTKATPPAPPSTSKPDSPRAAAVAAGREAAAVAAARSQGAATPSATDKKTPPPVPTAPKPERKDASGSTPAATANDASGKSAASASAGASSASDAGSAGKKTPPPVPTAPKPARPGTTTPATVPAAGTAASPPAAPAEEKDPNKFGGEASASKSTDKDANNKSSTFVGVGGGGSVKNKGATIKTGGKVNIQSGGKTTLTNTDLQAKGGENIDAKGGVERKTEKDTSVLNASTNSGPAGTDQIISKVPTASGTSPTGTPGVTAPTSDVAQGTTVAPQSALKAAQGSGSGNTPGVKKN